MKHGTKEEREINSDLSGKMKRNIMMYWNVSDPNEMSHF